MFNYHIHLTDVWSAVAEHEAISKQFKVKLLTKCASEFSVDVVVKCADVGSNEGDTLLSVTSTYLVTLTNFVMQYT